MAIEQSTPANSFDRIDDHKDHDTSHEELATHDVHHTDEALKALHSHIEPISEEEEKKVLRKIDWRLIPIMMLVNSVQLIDKNVCCNAFIYVR